MRLDHLILAVADLDAGAAALRDATGLQAGPGGTHPDWGTANRIAPLSDAYLELVTVVDPAVAARAAFGRAVAAARTPLQLVGWAVAPEDLDATAARLGLEVRRGRRALPGGGTLSWAMAGAEEALPRGLPFFLRWDDPAAAPARGAPTHDATVRWLELGGDRAETEAWLGAAGCDGVQLRFVAGAPPGPRRAGLDVDGLERVVGAG